MIFKRQKNGLVVPQLPPLAPDEPSWPPQAMVLSNVWTKSWRLLTNILSLVDLEDRGVCYHLKKNPPILHMWLGLPQYPSLVFFCLM